MLTQTILLVEDDYFMRTSLCIYLEDIGYKVIETASAAEALEKAHQAQLSAAIVDIVIPADASCPRGDIHQSVGLKLVRQLKRDAPNLGIVILSAHGDRGNEILEMLRSMQGLVYQVKGMRKPTWLAEAVCMAVRGDVWIDPDVDLTGPQKLSDFLLEICSPLERPIISRALEALFTLTPTETKKKKKIGQAYAVNRIADDLSITPGTVETHINHIYTKLFEKVKDLRKSVLLTKVSLIARAQEMGK